MQGVGRATMAGARSVGRAAVAGALCGTAALFGAVAASPAVAAYPGQDGPVLFTSTQDGGARHIFAAADGKVQDLTGSSSPAIDTQPKVSPDGREILFTSYAPGLPNTEIFVTALDGSDRTALTDTPQGNSDPTWSPDGTRIAFVSDRDGEPNIYVMSLDGSGLREITHDADGKSQLAWSPGGDEIAFVHEPAGGGDRDIYEVSASGGAAKDLTNDPSSDEVEPSFSPDGSEIAYSGPFHANHESTGADLWVMNAEGGGSRPLVHEGNGYSEGAFPAWSPDGASIAFAASNGTGYGHVWTAPAAGGQNSELVANAIPDSNPNDAEVDWGPAASSSRRLTRITKAAVSGRRVRFSFHALGPATSYRCRLRAAGGHPGRKAACHSPAVYKGLKAGRYRFEVLAIAPGEPYMTASKRLKIRGGKS